MNIQSLRSKIDSGDYSAGVIPAAPAKICKNCGHNYMFQDAPDKCPKCDNHLKEEFCQSLTDYKAAVVKWHNQESILLSHFITDWETVFSENDSFLRKINKDKFEGITSRQFYKHIRFVLNFYE